MAKPRLRMFAGPNGSGKSVLIEELKNSKIPLGPVVNADEIRKQLKHRGYLDLIQFRLKNIQQEDWNKALKEIAEIKNRLKKIPTVPEVHINLHYSQEIWFWIRRLGNGGGNVHVYVEQTIFEITQSTGKIRRV